LIRKTPALIARSAAFAADVKPAIEADGLKKDDAMSKDAMKRDETKK
jgi:pentapeptide MXKDX repeat protein